MWKENVSIDSHWQIKVKPGNISDPVVWKNVCFYIGSGEKPISQSHMQTDIHKVTMVMGYYLKADRSVTSCPF